MNTITKINLFAGTTENITVFSSEFTRKIESMNLNVSDVIIKINADTPKGRKQETEENEDKIKLLLAAYCDAGYNMNKIVYRPFMAGASDARKATSTWIDEKLIPELGKWALCGLSSKDMYIAVNKYMAYLGLLTSASKPFADVFGKAVDIRRVAIIKDGSITVNSKADIVTVDTVNNNQDRTCNINAFDGFGIIRKELTKDESCTIRGPWLKAFVQATDFTAIAGYAFKNGKNPEFIDFWGNTIALKDVDIILTESCFKAAKMYLGWQLYQNAFEQLGHTICVCVREHSPRIKGMPYQQGQTLSGDDQDALHFSNHAHSTVYKYHEAKNAANLLRGDHKLAAKLYPSLLNEPHTMKCVQEKYSSKRQDMLGGRIPALGYNAFLGPDMLAFVQHLFGMEVTGSLKAGECYCSAAKSGKVDVTRSPHLDHAHVILNNVEFMPFVSKTPTMFINIVDMTTIRLRADYDGDHVWYSQDEWLLDLIERTNKELNNLPIDWDVASAPKSKITKSTIANFICNLIHGSEIGIYADSLTKMWNSKYNRFTCNWLTYAGNVLIDAAKHASVKIDKPEAVKKLAETPLPEFARYAKADSETPADSSYWDEIREYTGTPRCAYSDSFLDKYSANVKKSIPETLEVEGLDELVFNPSLFMIKSDRKVIPGLCHQGTWNAETRTVENAGLVQQIAFRHSQEWKEVMGTVDAQMHRDEWEEACKEQALTEMIEYCRALYIDNPAIDKVSDEAILDSCYDNVVRRLFNTKMTDGMRTVMMQFFWRVFGDRVVKVLKSKHIGEEFTDDFSDLDIDDDDELFTID